MEGEGYNSCVLFYNDCKWLLVISHFDCVDKCTGETSILFFCLHVTVIVALM